MKINKLYIPLHLAVSLLVEEYFTSQNSQDLFRQFLSVGLNGDTVSVFLVKLA
jgi:hypothetical protein